MKEIEELGYRYEEIANFKRGTEDFNDFCMQVAQKYGDNPNVLNKIAALFGLRGSEMLFNAKKHKNETTIGYYAQKRDLKAKEEEYHQIGELVKKLIAVHTKEEVIQVLSLPQFRGLVIKNALIKDYIYDNYYDKAFPVFRKISKCLTFYLQYLKEQEEKAKLSEEEKRRKHAEEMADKAKEKEEMVKQKAIELYDFLLEHDEYLRLEDVRLGLGKINKQISQNMYNNIVKFWHTDLVNGISRFDILQNEFKKRKLLILEKEYGQMIENILPLVDSDIAVGDDTRTFDTLDCLTYFKSDFNTIVEYLRYKYVPQEDDDELRKKELKEAAILKNMMLIAISKIPQLENNNPSITFFTELEKEAIQNILEFKFNYSGLENKYLAYEDKLAIIDGLKKAGIPITRQLFEYAINKYHNGKLELITQENVYDYLEKAGIKKR